ncbi:MAG TPA: penicillin-binding transpeptidase domain-containing protein [Planctomycetota bacterium]|nr:penicillin-binding transpeptidase domain-containing protein [Planctomycetota bacterium]
MTLGYRGRLTLLAVLAAVLGGAFLTRLFAMQVAGRAAYRREAESQVAGKRAVHARRGRILDREGKELATEEAGFELTVRAAAWQSVMHECPRCGLVRFQPEKQPPGKCIRCGKRLVRVDRSDPAPLARLLGMSVEELRDRVETRVKEVVEIVEERVGTDLPPRQEKAERARLWGDYGWRPRRIARDVPYEVAREVELNPHQYPAFRIVSVHTRRASGGRDFVHILGLVREDSRRVDGIDVDLAVGVSGLERAFDAALQGEPGMMEVERDPRDGEERIVARTAPRHGEDIRLTIAAGDQARAVAALGGASGAFVVIDANDGSVLAAASSPTYDPDDYARVLAEVRDAKERLGRWPKHHALQESAFSGFDAPGSIVKPVTAVAALVSGVATPDTSIECDRHFRNRRGQPLDTLKCSSAHGEVTIHEALVRSCNVYFQTVQKEAIERGAFDRMFEVARRFGFGLPTGIELEPAPFPDTWDPGKDWANNVWMAIGQGRVRLSPAQVARAYAAIATGSLPRLRLVAEVGGQAVPPERTPLGIDESALRMVREALVEVPRRGTAAGHGLERWPISVKTGTAQLGGALQNAWLAGYVPEHRGRPAIAFALVLFDTELNAAAACAPVLEEFLRGFYGEDRP